jgi:hypothetical protein
MNSILHFAKLDMLSFKPYRKYLLLLPLAIFTVSDPRMLAVHFCIFLMLTTLSPYLFASEDKNSMHRLYALLPVRTKDIVWGRYLCCILGGLSYIVSMALILSACSVFTGASILNILYGLIACTALFLISTAFQFPIFFRMGFVKGKIAALAPTFILLGIVIASRQVISADPMENAALFGALNSTILLVIGIVAVMISVWVSIKLYQSREE